MRICPRCNTAEGVHGGCDCGYLKAWSSFDIQEISIEVNGVCVGDLHRYSLLFCLGEPVLYREGKRVTEDYTIRIVYKVEADKHGSSG